MREQRLRNVILGLVLFAGVIALSAGGGTWLPEGLVERVARESGETASGRLERWQAMFHSLQNQPSDVQLKEVNRFFNETVKYVSDQSHWGQEDYWATPLESLVSDGADCEDFVIAKYYTLKELGIPVDKLRITYVKALRINQAHMVLTYFPTPDGIPLVLDNLVGKIYRADKRRDLEPVYSFNASGMWLERLKGQGIRMGNPNKLDLWTDLRLRMASEGMNL